MVFCTDRHYLNWNSEINSQPALAGERSAAVSRLSRVLAYIAMTKEFVSWTHFLMPDITDFVSHSFFLTLHTLSYAT